MSGQVAEECASIARPCETQKARQILLLLQYHNPFRSAQEHLWCASSHRTCLQSAQIQQHTCYDTVPYGQPRYTLTFISLSCVL